MIGSSLNLTITITSALSNIVHSPEINIRKSTYDNKETYSEIGFQGQINQVLIIKVYYNWQAIWLQ